ncbi:probable beta-1,4-xylosyltransferase IRX9H [Malania oleifera]|uniref:probable beta-1,4-xylosyltransferase IRX9H n=1 Tax=Malania oleifera TaxID=397392 RepID=UPI0025ADD070|nr:probable beta-1,4-xylosyltransferase IRX9H [Malania oleifera]
MASIRRTLSPVPRAGALLNGEACSVASPLSKSSSCTQISTQSGGVSSPLFDASECYSAWYKLQALIFCLSLQRSSRPPERSKARGQVWRRSLFHFFICFMVGIFIGLTPIVSMNLSMNLMSKHQAFSFEMIPPIGKFESYGVVSRNKTSSVESQGINNTATSNPRAKKNVTSDDTRATLSLNQNSSLVLHRLLIIVTATHVRPLQAYYLNRLAHTLKLVPPPLLWIAVEMTSQSAETADILRRSGVMYRHLVCNKNLTDIKGRSIHQRNVALSHIQTHHLDGVVYFADDDNIYSLDIFEEMRQIRRFGTWMVPKMMESKGKVILEGPICNGTQVIGWHTDEMTRKFRRFHADISGFAFNSTILWDPKRWHRPTLEAIRQLDTVKESFQVSTFIEQVVEDESQMEGLLQDCSRIMVWHVHLESAYSFYPPEWYMKSNLDVISPLA